MQEDRLGYKLTCDSLYLLKAHEQLRSGGPCHPPTEIHCQLRVTMHKHLLLGGYMAMHKHKKVHQCTKFSSVVGGLSNAIL